MGQGHSTSYYLAQSWWVKSYGRGEKWESLIEDGGRQGRWDVGWVGVT